MAKKDVDPKMTARQVNNARGAISVGVLTSRLEKNAAGTLTDKEGNPIEMTTGQIKSAEILLSKTLPGLQSVEQTNPKKERTKADIEKDIKNLLTVDSLKALIKDNPSAQRQLLEATKQIEEELKPREVKKAE